MREVDQQRLARVVALVCEVLGPDSAGAYLFGSAVLGGLRPQSDLDVLVVSRRRTLIRSKDAAADWALARLSEERRTVLARARASYLSGEVEHWDDLQPQVRRHADHVVAEIGRLSTVAPRR